MDNPGHPIPHRISGTSGIRGLEKELNHGFIVRLEYEIKCNSRAGELSRRNKGIGEGGVREGLTGE